MGSARHHGASHRRASQHASLSASIDGAAAEHLYQRTTPIGAVCKHEYSYWVVSELNLPHVHYRRNSAQNNCPSSPDRAPPVENGCFSVRLHQRVHPSKLNLQWVRGFFSSYLHPVRHGRNLAGLVPVPRASECRERCRGGEQPRCHHAPLR